MKIEAKINRYEDGKGLLGFATVTLGGEFVVKGLTLRDSEKGVFVSYPSKKLKTPYTNNQGETKEYEDIFFPITRESRAKLNDEIVRQYYELVTPKEEDQVELPATNTEDDDFPF